MMSTLGNYSKTRARASKLLKGDLAHLLSSAPEEREETEPCMTLESPVAHPAVNVDRSAS